jgi:hypothetical protein
MTKSNIQTSRRNARWLRRLVRCHLSFCHKSTPENESGNLRAKGAAQAPESSAGSGDETNSESKQWLLTKVTIQLSGISAGSLLAFYLLGLPQTVCTVAKPLAILTWSLWPLLVLLQTLRENVAYRMTPNDPKLSHGAKNRKREFVHDRQRQEQPPLAPARC